MLRPVTVFGSLALLVAGCAGAPEYSFEPLPQPSVVAHDDSAGAVRLDSTAVDSFLAILGPHRSSRPVHLAFAGDINLGTLTLDEGIPPDSGRRLLLEVHEFLVGDLVIGNFESTLADSGTPAKCIRNGVVRRNCYAFVTPTFLAPRLVEAGFTHLTLANNHANDLGPEGRMATAQGLGDIGLRVVGPLGMIAIDTLWRADSITVVGLIGFTTYPHSYDLLDIDRSAAVVDSIRPLVDVLLVTFHGGDEGSDAIHTADGPEYLGREPRGDLRRWSRRVIDAGADAVVGHGPHVLRGIEFYRGRPIAYSLGNFVTYRGFNLSGPLGVTAVLQLTLDADGGYRDGRVIPLVQPPRQGPQPDATAQAIDLIAKVSAQDFGASAARLDASGRIGPPVP